ncbi:MAG: hypothetical protein E7441_10525 [Ruminococcaceae bacterium]|nr:hypothetical protein [Oscillospiraceae bacterium]
MMRMREITELVPVTYHDGENAIRLGCFADTLVYYTAKEGEHSLVAMRFGGYPEQVRAMSEALRKGSSFETGIKDERLIIKADNRAYRKSITHDGVYAESTLLALDDEMSEMNEEEEAEVKKPKQKRRMYIFCNEGDTDSLFAELDKKTAIPLIPEFRDYIISESIKRKILYPLTVMSLGVRFDAYMLVLSNDEKEMEEIVNSGLVHGEISIPNAVKSNAFDRIKTVSQYLNVYGVTIANRIRSSFNPLFDPATEKLCDRLNDINTHIHKNTGYYLFPAQLAVAESMKRRLDRAKVGVVVAECGSGKTKIGSSALGAHQNGEKCFNVVLCPSHMTKKWVREIEETLPDTKAETVYSLGDIDRAYKRYENGRESMYIILSKERARDGFMWEPAVVYSKSKKAYVCPTCGKVIECEVKYDGTKYKVPADQFFFRRQTTQNHKCEHCKSLLWSALNPNDKRRRYNKWVKIGNYGFVYRDFAERHIEQTKNDAATQKKLREIISNPDRVFTARGACVKYSMSSYISERIKSVDGVILDELHQFKGDSGQGDAMERLIECAKKVIGMTATLINGYSSGLFYLLYRITPHLMIVDNKEYENPNAFSNEYGVTERVYQVEESKYNDKSRSKRRFLREKQKPGVSPLVYSRFLIDCAVFLSLNDMGKHLPEYEEIPVALDLREDIKKEYERLEKEFRLVMNGRDKLARRVMSSFMSLLTTYPDQPYLHKPIVDPITGEEIITPKDLSDADEYYEKDEAVLDIVKRKVSDGGKVLVYTSWVKIESQPKLKKLLEDNGYSVAVLTQNVVPEKREEWVQKKLDAGIDVLITNPSLVETGLDLNAFTTLIFYNIGYNLFTFRQSSRRSWRINQTAKRVEVYILYYKGVAQARAIRLMASKLAAATLVEGNFSDEGLAAMSDCSDMTSQLARELIRGIRDDVEDVSAIFKKMAVIKDAEEDAASAVTVTVADVTSIAEKLRRARMFAAKAKGGTSVQGPKLYEYAGQLTMFEQAG